MLRRFWAWVWGQPVYWCKFGPHWTAQQLPWPKPSHYSHWFCYECFWSWDEEH